MFGTINSVIQSAIQFAGYLGPWFTAAMVLWLICAVTLALLLIFDSQQHEDETI